MASKWRHADVHVLLMLVATVTIAGALRWGHGPYPLGRTSTGLATGLRATEDTGSTGRRREAYVTLLYDEEKFLMGVRVLGQSLRESGTQRDLVVITTSSSLATISLLQADGWIVKRVMTLQNPNAGHPRRFWAVYTKLLVFNLTEYDRVVFLDADTLVLRNLDALFSCAGFCANLKHSDRFNSGVMVVTPSATLFQDMMRHMPTTASYTGGDQGFLNSYFSGFARARMFQEPCRAHRSATLPAVTAIATGDSSQLSHDLFDLDKLVGGDAQMAGLSHEQQGPRSRRWPLPGGKVALDLRRERKQRLEATAGAYGGDNVVSGSRQEALELVIEEAEKLGEAGAGHMILDQASGEPHSVLVSAAAGEVPDEGRKGLGLQPEELAARHGHLPKRAWRTPGHTRRPRVATWQGREGHEDLGRDEVGSEAPCALTKMAWERSREGSLAATIPRRAGRGGWGQRKWEGGRGFPSGGIFGSSAHTVQTAGTLSPGVTHGHMESSIAGHPTDPAREGVAGQGMDTEAGEDHSQLMAQGAAADDVDASAQEVALPAPAVRVPLHRLPAEFNADVGLYLISSNKFMQPRERLAIVHYTLGPLKPWQWWAPWVVDVASQWQEYRQRLPNQDPGSGIFGTMRLRRLCLALFLIPMGLLLATVCPFLAIACDYNQRHGSPSLQGYFSRVARLAAWLMARLPQPISKKLQWLLWRCHQQGYSPLVKAISRLISQPWRPQTKAKSEDWDADPAAQCAPAGERLSIRRHHSAPATDANGREGVDRDGCGARDHQGARAGCGHEVESCAASAAPSSHGHKHGGAAPWRCGMPAPPPTKDAAMTHGLRVALMDQLSPGYGPLRVAHGYPPCCCVALKPTCGGAAAIHGHPGAVSGHGGTHPGWQHPHLDVYAIGAMFASIIIGLGLPAGVLIPIETPPAVGWLLATEWGITLVFFLFGRLFLWEGIYRPAVAGTGFPIRPTARLASGDVGHVPSFACACCHILHTLRAHRRELAAVTKRPPPVWRTCAYGAICALLFASWPSYAGWFGVQDIAAR
eukprot:jgi/Mesvir1/3077/Mv12057-RA.2